MLGVGHNKIGENMSKHPVFAVTCVFLVWCASVHASESSAKDGELNGTIEITGLPPFKGHSITLSLFSVHGSDAPPPFPGNAPPEARLDEEKLTENNHFGREDNSGSIRTDFRLRRPRGWYYVQANVILYREHAGRKYAQVERFFFRERALEIPSAKGKQIVLPISWPPTSIEELGVYGKIKPQKKPQ